MDGLPARPVFPRPRVPGPFFRLSVVIVMLYFDHNATTPLRDRAREASRLAEAEFPGNPSSQHRWGRRARGFLEECRERFAALINVRPAEVVFTSGGTEANRLAILGCAAAMEAEAEPALQAAHSRLEHPSVTDVYSALEESARGLTVTRVGGRPDGRIDVDGVREALAGGVRLFSIQHANSETGVVQPLEELGDEFVSSDCMLHVDAVQSFGKIAVRPAELGADLLSVSGHKIGGPRGAGALWVRSGCRFRAPWKGGPQERGVRPGTENLAAIAGLVAAAEDALERPGAHGVRVDGRRFGAWVRGELAQRVPGVVFNGAEEAALPDTVNVSFPHLEGQLVVIRLDEEGVAVSTGSACASGSREPSPALQAMGLPAKQVEAAIRISAGWTTTASHARELLDILIRVVGELQARV